MKIKVVPEEIWKQMQEYMSEDAILVPEPVLDKLSEKKQTFIRKNEGKHVDYAFGGEPDREFDIVLGEGHYVFSEFEEDVGEYEDEEDEEEPDE